MGSKSSVFDMIGPVMIGPSSSHTAGVVRIGRTARRLLGGQPDEAHITFYNSFARTYEGHGSDRAILAGLLDFKTDDPRIKTAFDEAKKLNLAYQFKTVGSASVYHPNTVKLLLKKADRTVTVLGESRGGGIISIEEYNGFNAGFSANMHTLVVMTTDKQGAIAFISSILAQDGINVATMSVSRTGKHDQACQVIEMDSGLRPITLDYLRSLDWIHELIYIPDIDL